MCRNERPLGLLYTAGPTQAHEAQSCPPSKLISGPAQLNRTIQKWPNKSPVPAPKPPPQSPRQTLTAALLHFRPRPPPTTPPPLPGSPIPASGGPPRPFAQRACALRGRQLHPPPSSLHACNLRFAGASVRLVQPVPCCGRPSPPAVVAHCSPLPVATGSYNRAAALSLRSNCNQQ